MTATIPGFRYERLTASDGVRLNTAIGGSGSPVVLLHGFPQTHLMWRHVAAALAREHTVICPDLRGYGDSDKPAEDGPDTYSKRTMAADIVALAKTLGYDRFVLAGHDRGALVAIRAGLDYPGSVSHLAAMDVLPTLGMWSVLHGAGAAVAFHLYLMAQPSGLPEQMISASADAFFGYFLDAWARHPAAIPDDVRAEYLRASRGAVPSIVADYRATAGIDIEHDQADQAAGRVLDMPVTVVQQDWGTALGYDAAALWRPWAPDLAHHTLDAGHFMAEEAPEHITALLRQLMAREHKETVG
ncbi:MAG: alpha/beta fold hydrolase [Trebonia sp.]